tara:strand:- start:28 stop:597 length:570 start_codon:yes stop_codon:yes gene_type:complete
VCFSNPYEHEGALKKAEKDAAYFSEAMKYHNREQQAEWANDRATVGLSRAYSDLDTQALAIQGQGRLYSQNAFKDYLAKDNTLTGFDKTTKGYASTARSAGRNAYLELLGKQAQVESRLNNTFGRQMQAGQLTAMRQYQGQMASNRTKLGLPPTYGTPAMQRHPSFWEKTQGIRDVASFAKSMATGWNS